MMFLKNIVKHRKTRSNYAPSTDVEALHESTSVLHGDADTSPWNTLDTLTRDVSVCEQDDICDGVATYCDGPSTSVGDISTHLTNMKRKKRRTETDNVELETSILNTLSAVQPYLMNIQNRNSDDIFVESVSTNMSELMRKMNPKEKKEFKISILEFLAKYE
ncbi:uncharacterized protein LOC111635123 [Centruroides sculpturatus]|uniref:uncharacterized protein LOC111635123 n=1 Tax=Centruroides sculpturatus TaxID=218467 RepID=UPI000C6DDF29|nr:uncharacterized protein LOC111635123 [Centruroides sculpturatus]